MNRVFRFVVAAIAVLCAAAFAGSAGAARPTEPIDLSQLVVKAEVHDTVFNKQPPKPPPARIEQFVDPHGHIFSVGTDISGLDLRPYANVLASTIHRNETNTVLVEVVLPEQIAGICGDPNALACYYNDPAYGRGWMYIPSTDRDLAHIIVHEYGHHVDNQLLNLAHLDRSCARLGDGSRNWLVARAPGDFACESADWDFNLAELYAEDYVSLNGFSGWVLGGIRPPTAFELSQLAFDFAHPFWPRQFSKSGFVRRHRGMVKRFTVRHWTILGMSLTGTRSADLDLYLFRRGRQRPIAKSIGFGSREAIRRVLRPGTYDAVVYAYRASGTARVRAYLR